MFPNKHYSLCDKDKQSWEAGCLGYIYVGVRISHGKERCAYKGAIIISHPFGTQGVLTLTQMIEYLLLHNETSGLVSSLLVSFSEVPICGKVIVIGGGLLSSLCLDSAVAYYDEASDIKCS